MLHGQQIAVPPNTRVIRIARMPDHWIVWLYANVDFTVGTFLELHDSGLIERVTIGEEEERRFTVREAT